MTFTCSVQWSLQRTASNASSNCENSCHTCDAYNPQNGDDHPQRETQDGHEQDYHITHRVPLLEDTVVASGSAQHSSLQLVAVIDRPVGVDDRRHIEGTSEDTGNNDPMFFNLDGFGEVTSEICGMEVFDCDL